MSQADRAVATAHNYCVSFVDLLGQRETFSGQGALPRSGEDRAAFDAAVRGIIAIQDLQEDAEVLRWRPATNRRFTCDPIASPARF